MFYLITLTVEGDRIQSEVVESIRYRLFACSESPSINNNN